MTQKKQVLCGLQMIFPMLNCQTPAPIGAARLAKRHGIPVFAFAGSVTPEAAACNAAGIDAYFPILRGVSSLEEAMDRENAVRNMADAVEQVMRVWKLQEKTKKFKNF